MLTKTQPKMITGFAGAVDTLIEAYLAEHGGGGSGGGVGIEPIVIGLSGDGTTTGFTLSQVPDAVTVKYLNIFIHGLYQQTTEFTYTKSTKLLEFNVAPVAADPVGSVNIEVVVMATPIAGMSGMQSFEFEGDGTRKIFTLTDLEGVPSVVMVFAQGLFQNSAAYVFNPASGAVIFEDEVPAGVKIKILAGGDINAAGGGGGSGDGVTIEQVNDAISGQVTPLSNTVNDHEERITANKTLLDALVQAFSAYNEAVNDIAIKANAAATKTELTDAITGMLPFKGLAPTNLNDALDGGIYYLNGVSHSNIPTATLVSSSRAVLLVYDLGIGYRVQVIFPYGSGTVVGYRGGFINQTTQAVTFQAWQRPAASSHTHSNATGTVAGFMSGADKAKLDSAVALLAGGTITGGFNGTVNVLGNSSALPSNTAQLSPLVSNFYYIDNDAGFTLKPHATLTNYHITLRIADQAGAGAIITSDFLAVLGESYSPGSGSGWLFQISSINGTNVLNIARIR